MLSSNSPEEQGQVQDMGEFIDSVESLKPLRRGDVVEGIVMRVDSEGLLVSIGHKAEGIVPQREMRSLSPEDSERLEVGSSVVTFVIRDSTDEGSAILSIDRAIGEKAWHELEAMMGNSDTVQGTILGFNRGGAIVDVESIQGFVPMSQLVSVPHDQFREYQRRQEESDTESEKTGEKQPVPVDPRAESVGKELQLKILEINRARNRAIFSERQAVQEQREAQKARLIKELTEGDVRSGKVTGISSFGAFVDLGGADGLIHISELSWHPVKSIEEIVKLGDEIDVFVLRVDAQNKKIALSLRRLQPEPWETIHEKHVVGDIVDATITKLMNFGAFARVEGSVEGLVHISELSTRMIGHPREIVREGETLKLKILKIEPERRRLGLSLKQALEEGEFGGF